MTHRPTIDTLEAKRALEEAGLDPKVSEVLLRLIDAGIHNNTVDRAELEILRADFVKRQIDDLKWIAVLVGLLAGIGIIFQFVMNVFQTFQ